MILKMMRMKNYKKQYKDFVCIYKKMWMLQPFAPSPSLSLFDTHDDTLTDWWKSPKMTSLATDKIVHPQSYTYRFDMPGYNMSDIDIKIDNDRKMLIVQGYHKHEEGSPSSAQGMRGSYTYSLRSRGHVQKSISLDRDTIDDPERVQAQLENGVLSVTFPRMAPAPALASLPKSKNVKSIPITKGPHTVHSRSSYFS